MKTFLSTLVALSLLTSSAFACCCCKEHSGDKENFIPSVTDLSVTEVQQCQYAMYGYVQPSYTVTYAPTNQYFYVRRPVAPIRYGLRAWAGIPNPPLYQPYQYYIPVLSPLPSTPGNSK